MLVDAREDLLFHRQLRFHRDVPHYRRCFEDVHRLVDEAFLSVWSRDLGVELPISALQNMYAMAVENFYLQLTPATINYQWLEGYFAQLRGMIVELQRSGQLPVR